MLQVSEVGNNIIELSRSGQQTTSWFARHTQDVCDASLAEFELLMAAMGYRRAVEDAFGRTGTTG